MKSQILIEDGRGNERLDEKLGIGASFQVPVQFRVVQSQYPCFYGFATVLAAIQRCYSAGRLSGRITALVLSVETRALSVLNIRVVIPISLVFQRLNRNDDLKVMI